MPKVDGGMTNPPKAIDPLAGDDDGNIHSSLSTAVTTEGRSSGASLFPDGLCYRFCTFDLIFVSPSFLLINAYSRGAFS